MGFVSGEKVYIGKVRKAGGGGREGGERRCWEKNISGIIELCRIYGIITVLLPVGICICIRNLECKWGLERILSPERRRATS